MVLFKNFIWITFPMIITPNFYYYNHTNSLPFVAYFKNYSYLHHTLLVLALPILAFLSLSLICLCNNSSSNKTKMGGILLAPAAESKVIIIFPASSASRSQLSSACGITAAGLSSLLNGGLPEGSENLLNRYLLTSSTHGSPKLS